MLTIPAETGAKGSDASQKTIPGGFQLPANKSHVIAIALASAKAELEDANLSLNDYVWSFELMMHRNEGCFWERAEMENVIEGGIGYVRLRRAVVEVLERLIYDRRFDQ